MAGAINKRFDVNEVSLDLYKPRKMVYVAYVGSGNKAEQKMVCSSAEILAATTDKLPLVKPEFDVEFRKITDANEYDEVMVEDLYDSKDLPIAEVPGIKFDGPIISEFYNNFGELKQQVVYTAREF